MSAALQGSLLLLSSGRPHKRLLHELSMTTIKRFLFLGTPQCAGCFSPASPLTSADQWCELVNGSVVLCINVEQWVFHRYLFLLEANLE